jgi:hypothetical protein
MMKKTISLIIIQLCFFGTEVFAWHPQIHSIIGQIAQSNLKLKYPETLEKVFKMLSPIQNFFAEREGTLMEPSTMAYQISKNYFQLMNESRFTYKPIVYWKETETDVNIPNPASPQNITNSMNKAQMIVKKALLNGNYKAEDDQDTVKPGLIDSLMLRYLLNYSGNLHHPLDNSTFYSKTLFDGTIKAGDDNGEKIPVQDVFEGKLRTLKYLYDRAFGVLDLRKLEYPFSESISKLIESQAEYLMAKFPESHFEKNINNLNHLEWSEESYNIAADFAYSQVELFPVLNPEYILTAQTICQERIVLAGYRLYRLLVELFNSKSHQTEQLH